jgi:general secretion pathway protein L
MRLREALPNLVEEKTVADVGTLHVALGQHVGEGRTRTLAMVDRVWLAAIQVHVGRSGCKVAAIVPESLAVPLVDEAWSFGRVGTGATARCWLRVAAQDAMPLPDDAGSAAVLAAALLRQRVRPARLDVYAGDAEGRALGKTLATSFGVPHATHAADPFAAWLAGEGPAGGYGPPLSLLAFDGGSGWAGGLAAFGRWRIAALLALALVAVQIVGMQWQWAGLRAEANALRQRSVALLTTTFPDTRVVLDAPLQMARGLAGLRASAGRSDPGDFTTMLAATGRIFASLPSNALRGADFEARVLRLRFAPGNAVATDERDRFVAAAAQEGYALRFEAAANAAGEAQASLQLKTGAS